LFEGEILLRYRITLEIGDHHISLDIHGKDQKIGLEVVLNLNLIQHICLHAVTKWTLIHLKHDENAFFPSSLAVCNSSRKSPRL
jgi:hypothetical protein